ncbi:cytidylate kinase [Vittaforma corneae ATCC 50505]|uniref:(d)CMP kinase n=1 Tax=Vittaforma corneae (strain ATCC 50505) TaxID=993615 RepID=L2GQ47_VITCO|nr:cytidylate kinase [Vittaforma corneae ATCC 50505]ELA42452.1 cytidylate kinase [Vittaforma corneae ATCC 50505]
MKFIIAIDGPAASGKSSAAEIVAKVLGFQRIDSGLLYRAITYLIYQKFGNFQAHDLNSEEVQIFVNALQISQSNSRIFYDGKDITDYLRNPEIDLNVGKIAKELYIREKTHEIQRSLMELDVPGIVIDGRDIGTVVVPNAFLKVFIAAKDTTRAQRRSKQTGENYEDVLKKLQDRDRDDINRKHGPLKKAEDAILIDNDNITLEETVNQIIKYFKNRMDGNEEASKNPYFNKTVNLISKYFSERSVVI